MHTWIDVAMLTKTKNLKGRFVAKRAAGLPYVLTQGAEVAFVPPQTDVVRRAIVRDVREIDGQRYEVSFDGIDAAGADALVGCHCLVPRKLVDDSATPDEPARWMGWQVVSSEGERIGAVSGIVRNPAQALIEVERYDGTGTLLVPAVDEIIVDIREDDGIIEADLPDGLLDL